MASKSTVITQEQLTEMKQHISDLKELRKEVVLASDAGIPLDYTVQDIDKQIASLENIIRTYEIR